MLTVDIEKFAIRNGDYILDLGCGQGRHVNALPMFGDITAVGVDLDFQDVRIAKERHSYHEQGKAYHIVGDGLVLPFANHTFDKVICSEVLEHIPNYNGFLKEIDRVLKPGGQLCVSVPRFWPEKICWWLSDEYHNVPGGHIRIFKDNDLRDSISKLGFQYIGRHWAHALHAPFWWLKCLWWERQDSHFILRAYHKILVWDLMKKPFLTRFVEKCLNPVIGKSVVLYFKKNEHSP
jgi:SAM-dependent methyltransferase